MVNKKNNTKSNKKWMKKYIEKKMIGRVMIIIKL